jgi:outer membrane protein
MAGKISLAINALLIIAVIVLFKNSASSTEDNLDAAESASGKPSLVSASFSANDSTKIPVVAYISEDSIMANYQFVIDEGGELEKKLKAKRNALASKYSKYEGERAKWEKVVSESTDQESYQRNYNMAAEDLMKMEQVLQGEEMELQQEVGVMQLDFNTALYEKVTEFLKRYSTENNIDLVLNYKKELSTVLYTAQRLDITADVVSGLNSEYKAPKVAK